MPALGVVHQDLGQTVDAIACYRAAVALAPDLAQAHCNLGTALKAQHKLDEAVICYAHALRINPADPQAHNNLGNAYKAQGRLEWTIDSFRKATTHDADFATAHWNLGLGLLLSGALREGFAEYEYRFSGGDAADFAQSNRLLRLLAAIPRWNGDKLQGRSLLVWTKQQGQGDSLMMMRYLPRIASRGVGRVVVLCEPSLVRVVAHMPGVAQVVAKNQKPDLHGIDLHCPLLSLPHIFGTELGTVPADYAGRWSARHFGRARLLRVGLVWAGGPSLRRNTQRSMALADFAPLFNLDGV